MAKAKKTAGKKTVVKTKGIFSGKLDMAKVNKAKALEALQELASVEEDIMGEDFEFGAADPEEGTDEHARREAVLDQLQAAMGLATVTIGTDTLLELAMDATGYNP
jgi:hypothetical protein